MYHVFFILSCFYRIRRFNNLRNMWGTKRYRQKCQTAARVRLCPFQRASIFGILCVMLLTSIHFISLVAAWNVLIC